MRLARGVPRAQRILFISPRALMTLARSAWHGDTPDASQESVSPFVASQTRVMRVPRRGRERVSERQGLHCVCSGSNRSANSMCAKRTLVFSHLFMVTQAADCCSRYTVELCLCSVLLYFSTKVLHDDYRHDF